MKKTIPGNMLYLLNILWKIDRSTFWSMQLHILLGAIVPFISVLIPSAVDCILSVMYIWEEPIWIMLYWKMRNTRKSWRTR